jgi:L-lactate utilization protein LutC
LNKNLSAKTATPKTKLPTTPTNQRLIRRIGTTTYRVAVHFSETSKETMNDKITRMIKNEAAGKVVNL